MSQGVIYIFTSPSFPRLVKLGYTSDLHRRLDDLNHSTALPYAFHVYAVYETDHELEDKALHKLIDRLNPDLRTTEILNGKRRVREFFEMSPEDAYSILDAIARISGTEDRLYHTTPAGNKVEEERDAEQSGTRQPPFKFSKAGLKPGDVVEFVQDRNKRATVVDDSHVEYEGDTWSLSALAEQLTGRSSLRGPQFFTYEGELLTDRRDRMEADGSTK